MELDLVPVVVLKETAAAYLLCDEEGAEAWFPKSQVSFKMRNIKTGKATAEIPLWLLTQKGWNK